MDGPPPSEMTHAVQYALDEQTHPIRGRNHRQNGDGYIKHVFKDGLSYLFGTALYGKSNTAIFYLSMHLRQNFLVHERRLSQLYITQRAMNCAVIMHCILIDSKKVLCVLRGVGGCTYRMFTISNGLPTIPPQRPASNNR